MDWNEWFFSMAEAVSKKSICLSRQIGCIAVRDKKYIVAMGYNGPPIGYPHCVSAGVIKSPNLFNEEDMKRMQQGTGTSMTITASATCSYFGCPRRMKGYKSGEGLEECPAEHAERNVICEAARLGIPLQGCVLYMNCEVPCRECAKAIVNAGIVEINCKSKGVYPEPGLSGIEIFEKCKIKIYIDGLR